MAGEVTVTTGAPMQGSTSLIQITSGSYSYVLNGADSIPLRPGMEAPETSRQDFQGGNYNSATQNDSYSDDNITAEYKEEIYSAIDSVRAAGGSWLVQRFVAGTASGSALRAILWVGDGPTLTVKGKAIPTMSVSVHYLGTQSKPDPESVI